MKKENRMTSGKNANPLTTSLMHTFRLQNRINRENVCLANSIIVFQTAKTPPRFLAFFPYLDKYLSKSYKYWIHVDERTCAFIHVSYLSISLWQRRHFNSNPKENGIKSNVKYTSIELYSNGIKMISPSTIHILTEIWLLFDSHSLHTSHANRAHSSQASDTIKAIPPSAHN